MEAVAHHEASLRSACRAYGEVAAAAVSPAIASIMLHERLCSEVGAAKAAYQAGRLDQMCRKLDKCLRVLLVLQNDLGQSNPGGSSTILSGLYLHLYREVRGVLRQKDVPAAFDRILAVLLALSENMRLVQRARV